MAPGGLPGSGCAVESVKQDLTDARRMRRVARLVTGMGLDRAQVEKLLNDKVCGVGGERVYFESETYGRPGERDEVEARSPPRLRGAVGGARRARR